MTETFNLIAAIEHLHKAKTRFDLEGYEQARDVCKVLIKEIVNFVDSLEEGVFEE